jgi:hypothetical protein
MAKVTGHVARWYHALAGQVAAKPKRAPFAAKTMFPGPGL